MLNTIGSEAVGIFNNFAMTEKDRKNYKKANTEVEKDMKPRKSIIYKRFLFYSRKQVPGEPLDST